jgi:hypothetical protein
MSGRLHLVSAEIPQERPLIAFFDYPDVFEDFYPHYGVDQRSFATRWAATGNHAFLSLVQREIGDIVWYAFALPPEFTEARHKVVGCRVKFLPSSWLHRCLWRLFYMPRVAWRWCRAYTAYAIVASYAALTSWPFIRTLLSDWPDFFFVQDYATGRFDVLLLIAWALHVPLIAAMLEAVQRNTWGNLPSDGQFAAPTGSSSPAATSWRCWQVVIASRASV